MAKQEEFPHWGSKGAINRAGEALRGGKLERGHAAILESWRMAHRDVINSFQSLLRARAKDLDVQVAQRLKRRSTIIDKLSRHDGMQLARMDDVAGCRLIFPSIKMLHEFRSKVHHAKFKHIRKNEKDKYNYIERPSDRGYRGIHDIYEHRSKSKKGNPRCDGLLIEIQYRTSIQHAWSTAVEVVTEVTEHEPKFDRGDRRYVELFRLASEMLARTLEECPPRLFADLSNKELYAAFEKLNGEIGVMHMLVNLVINDWVGDHIEADHIILHIGKKNGFKLYQFDLELEASSRLLELEKEFPEDNIVLVGARNVEEVKSAFRNYFNDVKDFLGMMMRAYNLLDPETHAARMAEYGIQQ
ncbi:RelA/SpoT domain-containing protein [Bradyrhizobium sp. 76]|uniref:RelA/SpoT domain-containing protein n=1 Tax=Bradyrhizobium sp. 76 TaxID=2782680 RepID=UPI001FFAD335|nr:RelA/SpoT domain-containing protein [Bradyrhizobium sp. 76]MCK1408558.1 RelA/SpoT domain-containing protein [Bradyrhizobium sp. 76]